jgi:hypothetical protein
MTKDHGLHRSTTKIPPHNLVKIPIRKQSFLSNLILGRLKRFGLHKMTSYHLTRKRLGNAVYPYMPENLPDDVYLYDFHSHSANSDGKGTFEEVLTEISQKKHLNGLALTDHPWHLGADKETRIPDEKVISRSFKFHKVAEDYKKKGKLPENFITFPGSCEFFMKFSEKFPSSEIELLAIGLSEDFLKDVKDLNKIASGYAAEFIERVHDNNGLVIVPHPFYFVRSYELFRSKNSRNSRPDAIESINYMIGFLADKGYQDFFNKLPFSDEVRYIGTNFGYFNWIATIITQENNFGKNFNSFPLARQVAAVGSSDAHFKSMLGAASTLLKEPITSFEDLRKVFKQKKTFPMYNPIWGENTNKYSVYKEMWQTYGDRINKGLEETSLLYWMASKFFVDLLAYFFV